ncbi:TPA: restriction endonuclease subunit S [Streptococcus suis]
MPNKERNIPKRRFKEFENADAWELRKLGEVVYRSNITSSSKVLPRLEFEDINSGLGTLNKDIFQKVNDDRKGLEFNEGDVLFGKLRPYLKNWWYAEFNGIALGDFWNLKSDVWHSCFLYTYIQSNAFQLVANDTSGTKMPRSDWNLVAESIAKFPTLPEQSAIGTFFSTLDRHITLHQRKLDKLKSVKQAYLSEMFPAEGERVPKRRFPGFTDDWELRKLGEVADVTKLAGFEFTEHVVYSEEGNIIALRGLNIKDGRLVLDDVKYIDGSNFSKLNRSKLYVDDIMFTYVGTVGEVAIIKENDRFYLAPNVSRIRVQSEDSSKFISHYIRSEFFYNRVIFPLIATSSQPALSMENIRKFDIFLPIINEEQIRISELFDTLDRQITLHQRKLEKLKNLKKALLNELFV